VDELYDFLIVRPYRGLGNLLVLGLMVASAIEHAARASLYVRDRI